MFKILKFGYLKCLKRLLYTEESVNLLSFLFHNYQFLKIHVEFPS